MPRDPNSYDRLVIRTDGKQFRATYANIRARVGDAPDVIEATLPTLGRAQAALRDFCNAKGGIRDAIGANSARRDGDGLRAVGRDASGDSKQ